MAVSQTLHLDRYTPDAKNLVVGAQRLADDWRHPLVEPLHLLHFALENDRGVQEVFKAAGANPVAISDDTEAALKKCPKGRAEADLSPELLELLARAERDSENEKAPNVGTSHVLNALSQEVRGVVGSALQAAHVMPGSLRPHMGALKTVPRDAIAMADSMSATVDLLASAQGSDPVIGRDSEVRRLCKSSSDGRRTIRS